MKSLASYLEHRLLCRKRIGIWRELKVPCHKMIDFASNDYLGILHENLLDDLVKSEFEDLKEEKQKWHGASGSRLLTGNTFYCETLETEIAHFHQAESGLIFNSGYLANLALLSAIVRPQDSLFYSQGIHASWHDAFKLSRIAATPFKLDELEQLLRKASGYRFVCVQTICSCTGSELNLEAIQEICESYDAHLIVDEAHATGWLGEKGVGGVQKRGLQTKIFARVHTFSKALGSQGAIILGNPVLRDYLINFARPFIYTTALSLYHLAVIRSAYYLINHYCHYRRELMERITYFKEKMIKLSIPFLFSDSPIQCLRIKRAKHIADYLQTQGIDVRPLLFPTVSRGEECLRICLHAFNTNEEIDFLLTTLRQALP